MRRGFCRALCSKRGKVCSAHHMWPCVWAHPPRSLYLEGRLSNHIQDLMGGGTKAAALTVRPGPPHGSYVIDVIDVIDVIEASTCRTIRARKPNVHSSAWLCCRGVALAAAECLGNGKPQHSTHGTKVRFGIAVRYGATRYGTCGSAPYCSRSSAVACSPCDTAPCSEENQI
jgi:hypothetical protein